jgi:glycosyltransferase involved in cell wall biosynthesis
VILGFHSNFLGERGTEVALFDYAKAARDLFAIQPRIYVPRTVERVVPGVRRRFEEEFEFHLYANPRDIDCDALYVIKMGMPGRITERIPELNHAVFYVHRPHGHRFAAVSKWLASRSRYVLTLPGGRSLLTVRRIKPPEWVPHIVDLPDVTGDLRAELGIPDDAVVFGRHGGYREFNISFVKQAIERVLDERADMYFVFVNTERFADNPRIVHIPTLTDREAIRAFINTCDYMIHAQKWGETFGLAPAEFAVCGAPVLTFAATKGRGHLELIDRELLLEYSTYEEVLELFRTAARRREPVPSTLGARLSPPVVMERFREVFLTG